MRKIQLREAKATLSALVEEAAHGETSVITRHGKPRAVIVGVDEWNRPPRCSFLRPAVGCRPAGGRRPAAARHEPITGHRTLGASPVPG